MQETDMLLLSVLSTVTDGWIVASDADITDRYSALLRSVGVSTEGSWSVGGDGRWHLDLVAAYTERLCALGWVASDGALLVLTSHGMRRCVESLREALDDPSRGVALWGGAREVGIDLRAIMTAVRG